ncbi:J domain-containing protein [Aeoliella mucimassa]|uniref:J domain-containing protein n=1 Tax=Aeoliella mucimassa TaxID=2527972 RepID=A0A518AUL2_9BACT|nr:J domain-containing protein [Aeoliella mucimassa]QDU58407.1 hypothetical protein Pan181_46420 [Aeoliella mucimassa]
MRPAEVHRNRDGRPDFMVKLGLAPPYAPDDVKHAYLSKVKEVHPDLGGDPQAFREVHEAYLQAQEFLSIKGDSLRWIGNHMEEYLESRVLASQLRELGATVQTASIDWLRRSFGDFAELTETILAVGLKNAEPKTADAVLTSMTAAPAAMHRLTRLELPHCGLGDAAVDKITVFKGIERLNLTGNAISSAAAQSLVNRLPSLMELDISDTKVGWWTKRRIVATIRKRME